MCPAPILISKYTQFFLTRKKPFQPVNFNAHFLGGVHIEQQGLFQKSCLLINFKIKFLTVLQMKVEIICFSTLFFSVNKKNIVRERISLLFNH
mgnify:FL=1